MPNIRNAFDACAVIGASSAGTRFAAASPEEITPTVQEFLRTTNVVFLPVRPQKLEAFMSEAEGSKGLEQKSGGSNKVVWTAIERAKAKNARLRLMKERNENYLAEQREEHQEAEELTGDLRAFGAVEDGA